MYHNKRHRVLSTLITSYYRVKKLRSVFLVLLLLFIRTITWGKLKHPFLLSTVFARNRWEFPYLGFWSEIRDGLVMNVPDESLMLYLSGLKSFVEMLQYETNTSDCVINSPSGLVQAPFDWLTAKIWVLGRTDCMTWLVVGRLRGEAKALRDKKQPKYLRDAIKTVYFLTPTPKDYCFRTRLSIVFFFFRLWWRALHGPAIIFVRQLFMKGGS